MRIELKNDIPVPDQQSIIHVTGVLDTNLYKSSGKSLAYQYCLILKKYFGKHLSDFDAILDFGVGSNRICSWFPDAILDKLVGTDVNHHTIRYCSETFRGKYLPSNMVPPLDFSDNTFDLVFSFSVFSHLDIPLARKWINELYRITKKGAVLLISTHLEWISLNHLDNIQLIDYNKNGVLAINYQAAGKDHHESGYINIFFTKDYWKLLWEDKFKIIHIGYGKNANEFNPFFTPRDIKRQLLPVGQSITVLKRR